MKSRLETHTSGEKPLTVEVSMPKMETRVASPSHFLLKVGSLSLLGNHGIQKYETGEFYAGGYKWRLIIDFNANNNNYISAYLAISDTSLPAHFEVNAVFSIFLMNQISGNYHYSSGTRCFIPVKSQWGFSQFISKKALNDPSNGFLINDDCVFGVEVFIIRNSFVFQSLLLRNVTVPYMPNGKISKLRDVWGFKQSVLIDEYPKWEICVPTKRKDEDEECSCLEFCKLVLDATRLKIKHYKNDIECEYDDHNKTVADVTLFETREASPTHLLVKVKPFSLLGKNRVREIVAGKFDAGGYKWSLTICPNEDKDGIDSNYISVYLALSDPTSLQPANWEVNAVFSIFLFNQNSGNYHYSLGRTRRFLAMKSKWGISHFISKEVLMDPSKGFLIDNGCVFGAEVFILEKSAVCECVRVKKVSDPFKREWKISNLSKLGNVWTSEHFIADGLTWELSVYPKGRLSEESSLSAYVRLVDDSKRLKKVDASLTICIKNQVYKRHCGNKSDSHRFTPNSNCFGWASFIEPSTLEDPKSGFIINDCCLLEIEILVQAIIV